MRALVIATLISICAVQATASETTRGKTGTVEQKKAEILQHIQERITNSQAEIACVKAAASHEEFKACHEKYRPTPPKNDQRPHTPQE